MLTTGPNRKATTPYRVQIIQNVAGRVTIRTIVKAAAVAELMMTIGAPVHVAVAITTTGANRAAAGGAMEVRTEAAEVGFFHPGDYLNFVEICI